MGKIQPRGQTRVLKNVRQFKEKLTEYIRITKDTPERLQVWFGTKVVLV